LTKRYPERRLNIQSLPFIWLMRLEEEFLTLVEDIDERKGN
jgi:hypothetical protein